MVDAEATAAQGSEFGLGFATGALIGAAPYYYGSGYGYDDYAYSGDGYDDGYAAVPAYGGDRDDATACNGSSRTI